MAQLQCAGLQIRLPRDANNCGRCQNCNFPLQIPNNEQTRCITRPKPTCSCVQRSANQGYSCVDCLPGQVTDITNPNRDTCITPSPCLGPQQITLAVDRVSCGRCQTCPLPRQVPDITKTRCVDRPLAVCGCLERQSADGYSCEPCPPGQVTMQNNPK